MHVVTQALLYRNWCKNFQRYQSQTTHMVRKIANRPVLFNFNPYSNNKIDKILEHYEKSFW